MKGLKGKICETVLNETGIKLTPKDIGVKIETDYVLVKLWETEMLRLSIHGHRDTESNEFAEDLLDALFDEYYDLREKIIEVKINDLNNRLRPEVVENINALLKKSKVDEGLIEILDYEFVDMGYIKAPYSNPDDEEWGFPIIALRITDFEDLEFLYTIDIYQDPLKLDYNLISKEFIKKIR